MRNNGFAVFIIGTPGKLRSASLQEWASGESGFTVHFIEPVFAKFRQGPVFLRAYLTLHYAHALTDGEWGCAIAHLRAQERAKSLKVQNALFLEDDAVIGPDFDELVMDAVDWLSQLKDSPAVIHGSNPSVRSGFLAQEESKEPTPLVVMPIYAIAYLMNRSAIAVAVDASHKSLPVGKADFPAWSSETLWFSSSKPLALGHDTKFSRVGVRPLASKQSGVHWQLVIFILRIILSIIPTPIRKKKFRWELRDFLLGTRIASFIRRK